MSLVTTSPQAKTSEVWTEKYRPRKLKDIHGHASICRYLNRILTIQPAGRPHLLFHGPPGTGKTTLAYAYTSELYPEFSMPLFSMYLNASDERTIEVIRDRIIDFAKTSWPGIQRKVIIFDEVETMTDSAQIALRALLDEYDENPTRAPQFIFICNCLSRVQTLIRSRCLCFYMGSLSPQHMQNMLTDIGKREGRPAEEVPTKLGLYLSKGDMRQIVIQYQNCNLIDKKLQYIIRLMNAPRDRLNYVLDEILQNISQNHLLMALLTILRWLGWDTANPTLFTDLLHGCMYVSLFPHSTDPLKDLLKSVFDRMEKHFLGSVV
jgi:DNA polymerase III delta prime subunit